MTELRQVPSQRVENWDTFVGRLDPFTEEQKDSLLFAYQLAKFAHRDQWRISGERYFEHLRGVALILLDECQVKDDAIISAALLHDTLEDTTIFGNPKKFPHSQWIKKADKWIAHIFSPQTAEIVVALTEPVVDDVEIMDKTQAKQIKYAKLHTASPEALLVKMADRLHNLRTFHPKPYEKSPRERIRETEEILIPIFHGAAEAYPIETEYLLREIDKAIIQLRVYTTSSRDR